MSWLKQQLGRLGRRRRISLPEYGRSFLEHLIASYRALGVRHPQAEDLINEYRNSPERITWGHVYELESAIFSLLSPDELVRSLWSLRARFREIAGPAAYDRYSASGIPNEADSPEKLRLLRADVSRLLEALYAHYALMPLRESTRTRLTLICLRMVIFYSVLYAGVLLWCGLHNASFLAMIASVLYAGVVGGFVSSQRHMQNVPTEGDPLVSAAGLANSIYYLWLSPLLGAIFSIVLASMFMAAFLQGPVFPEFHVSKDGEGLPFFHFTWNTLPTSSEEYAKLLIWAFVAGFAERLVPDSLDRLTTKLNALGKEPVVPPAPPTAPPARNEERPGLGARTLAEPSGSGGTTPAGKREMS